MKINVTEEVPVKIRDAMVPSPGYVWVSCDYSQLEYRTMANLAEEKQLIDSFMAGVDFHTATASMMLGIPVDQVDKKSRKVGKTLNFGVSYGMSVNGLAQRLGCTKEEAQEKQNLYFRNIPKLQELINRTKAETKARGYSRTFFGRMRPFKGLLEKAAGNWYKEDSVLKQSFNTRIQGTGADFAKIALGRAYQALKPYGDRVRILTQVHDEINYEVQCVNPDGSIDSDFLAEVLKVIDYAMSFRGVYPGWADIPADIEIGWNYGSLKGPDEIKEEFGVDVLAIQASQPKTDLPKFLFENLNYDVISKTDLREAQKSLHQNTKGSSQKASTSSRTDTKTSGGETSTTENQGPSRGQEMAKKVEQKMRAGGKIDGRLDLTDCEFRTSTVLIHLKDGVNDREAFDCLKAHVKDNFGTYDVVLEHQGILYRFHSDFRVNNNISDLEEFFDVDVFDVKPRVVLSL